MKKKLVISFLLMIFAIGCVSAHDNNTTDIASNDVVVNGVDCSNVTLDSNSNSNSSIDNFYNVDVNDEVNGTNASIFIEINDNHVAGVQKNIIKSEFLIDNGYLIPLELFPTNSGYLATFNLYDLAPGEHTISLQFTVLHESIGSQAVSTDTFTIDKNIIIE